MNPSHQDSRKAIHRLRIASISRLDAFKQRLITHCLKLDDPKLKHEATLTVILEGVWSQTELSLGNIIHLVQPRYELQQDVYIIDNSIGLLVLEPDHYISCSAITTALFCERKSWLNDIFLNRVGTHPNRLVGTIVHEVFLNALKNHIVDKTQMMDYLDTVLTKPSHILSEMLATGKSASFFKLEASKYIGNMKEWLCTYTSFAYSSSRNMLGNVSNNNTLTMHLHDEFDIESIVESTTYGLKGKVDVAGQVRIHDKSSNTSKGIVAAIELKTVCDNPRIGPSLGHRAQLDLYTMILDDILQGCDRGFVTYLKNGPEMYEACMTHNIRRDLIHRRNQLVCTFKNPFVGPAFFAKLDACKPCDKLSECLITHKLYEGNQKNYPKMSPLEPQALGHLDDQMLRFFKEQNERLARLLQDSSRELNYEDLESIDDGFRKLKLVKDERKPDLLVFNRHPQFIENYAPNENRPGSSSSQPFQRPNEPVTMQLKPFDTSVDYTVLRVVVRPDQDPLMQVRQTPMAGVMCDISQTRLAVKLFNKQRMHECRLDTIYRIDKIYYERDSMIRTMRRTLSRFLERRGLNSSRLRKLVSDPSYAPIASRQLRQELESSGNEELFDLDPDQLPIVLNAVCTENYQVLTESSLGSRDALFKSLGLILSLIAGLKRTTLIAARRVAHLKDVMRLLRDKDCKFLLIDDGKSKSVTRHFSDYLLVPPGEEHEVHRDHVKKFELIKQHYDMAPLVVTSCAMTAESVLFARRTFDYCFVFDCDNTEVLVGLAPLFCADRHIIIDIRAAAASQTESAGQKGGAREGILSLGEHLRSLRGQRSRGEPS